MPSVSLASAGAAVHRARRACRAARSIAQVVEDARELLLVGARFSSITSTYFSPAEKRRTPSGSSGRTIPTLTSTGPRCSTCRSALRRDHGPAKARSANRSNRSRDTPARSTVSAPGSRHAARPGSGARSREHAAGCIAAERATPPCFAVAGVVWHASAARSQDDQAPGPCRTMRTPSCASACDVACCVPRRRRRGPRRRPARTTSCSSSIARACHSPMSSVPSSQPRRPRSARRAQPPRDRPERLLIGSQHQRLFADQVHATTTRR